MGGRESGIKRDFEEIKERACVWSRVDGIPRAAASQGPHGLHPRLKSHMKGFPWRRW